MSKKFTRNFDFVNYPEGKIFEIFNLDRNFLLLIICFDLLLIARRSNDGAYYTTNRRFVNRGPEEIPKIFGILGKEAGTIVFVHRLADFTDYFGNCGLILRFVLDRLSQ